MVQCAKRFNEYVYSPQRQNTEQTHTHTYARKIVDKIKKHTIYKKEEAAKNLQTSQVTRHTSVYRHESLKCL